MEVRHGRGSFVREVSASSAPQLVEALLRDRRTITRDLLEQILVFRRHIPAEHVDMQVLKAMQEMIQGNEDLLSEQAAKMLGQDDIFSRAMIETQLKQMDQQFDQLMETGIPEETRAYIGMTGFRIRIDLHGDVIDIEQPGMIDPGDE